MCIIFQIVWVPKPNVSEIYFLKCRFPPMIYKYTSKHSLLFLLCPHPTYRNRKWKWISPFGWKDRWISSQSNKNPLYWQPWKNHYLPWSAKHLPALWWNCGMLLFTIKTVLGLFHKTKQSYRFIFGKIIFRWCNECFFNLSYVFLTLAKTWSSKTHWRVFMYVCKNA